MADGVQREGATIRLTDVYASPPSLLPTAVIISLLALAGSGCTPTERPSPQPVAGEAATGGTSAGNPLGPFKATTSPAAPCDSGFIADMISDFEGHETAELALTAWVQGDDLRVGPVLAGVPREGWAAAGRGDAESVDERSFVAGDWRAVARQSTKEQWLITQLDCLPSSQDR